MKKFDRFFDDMHSVAVRVRNHINKYGPIVSSLPERVDTNDRDGHLLALHTRVRGWIQTLAKLDSPADLQAIACCCRSSLEIAVDVLLLAADPTNVQGDKLRWWDLSALYQMSNTFVQYNKEIRTNKNSPDVVEARNFAKRNESLVMLMREKLWPMWKKDNSFVHPPRWTGNGDLKADIHVVDRGPLKELIKENVGSTLLKFYVADYQRLNKTIHGAGLIGVKGSARSISARAADGIWAGASLAMLCHQVVAIDRGLDKSIPKLRDEWNHLKIVNGSSFIYHVHETEGEDLDWP